MYYRMSQIGDALPITWSYSGPPVGILTDEDPIWKVGRGAQVWRRPSQVALCALGADMDGTYDEGEGYDRLLIIEADYTVDGGSWDASSTQRRDSSPERFDGEMDHLPSRNARGERP